MKTKWKTQFNKWTGPEVVSTFGLIDDPAWPPAREWIEAPAHPYTEAVEQQLEDLRQRLRRLNPGWNETELLAQFIGPLLVMVNFSGLAYNLFLERKLTAQFDRGRVSGQVDGLVARGVSDPEVPIFFLHEYKKMKGSDADPQGQLLITMIAAQHLNANSGPLYGCYVLGKYWTFVYLDGTTFAESQGYDASDAGELQIIWNILHETKRRIEARVALLDES